MRQFYARWQRIPAGTVPALVVLGSLIAGLYVVLSVLSELLL